MVSSISDATGGSSFSLSRWIPLYAVAWSRAASLAPWTLNSSAMSRARWSGLSFSEPAFASMSLPSFPSLPL